MFNDVGCPNMNSSSIAPVAVEFNKANVIML